MVKIRDRKPMIKKYKIVGTENILVVIRNEEFDHFSLCPEDLIPKEELNRKRYYKSVSDESRGGYFTKFYYFKLEEDDENGDKLICMENQFGRDSDGNFFDYWNSTEYEWKLKMVEDWWMPL